MNTEITDENAKDLRDWGHFDGAGSPLSPSARFFRQGLNRFDWLPLILLPVAVVTFRNRMAPWVFMWTLSAGIFLGCKWLTWRKALLNGVRPCTIRSVGYFLGWPGMDAGNFLRGMRSETPKTSTTQWLFAATKMSTGIALVLFAARVHDWPPLLIGWLGMLGIILFLHFGLFALIALAWQSAGVNANPVMRSPIFATSLAEFWSARWNTAFNVLAHELAFRPLVRKFGVARATLGVFLISGIIHDLVISLPARAGFGLPTAYFVFQGVAILAERSVLGRRLGLGKGFRGWLFTLMCSGAPAFWLFHPAFITNVILPMLHVIGGN